MIYDFRFLKLKLESPLHKIRLFGARRYFVWQRFLPAQQDLFARRHFVGKRHLASLLLLAGLIALSSAPLIAQRSSASATKTASSRITQQEIERFGVDADEAFRQGVEFYLGQRYADAVLTLVESKHPASRLFIGKSFYMTGNFLEAIPPLLQSQNSSITAISEEASYLLGLSHIQLREYTSALRHLSTLELAKNADLRSKSSLLKRQTIGFLTDYQLLEVLRSTTDTRLLGDLYRYASSSTSELLLEAIRETINRLDPDAGLIPRIPPVISASGVTSTVAYRVPPTDFGYTVGVVLPAPDGDPEILKTSKEIYQGILSAIELMGQDPNSPRIHLRYLNSHAVPDSMESIVRESWFRDRMDVLIGPLFSDNAIALSRYADLYRIPVVAPLANSDGIREEGSMTIQLNPPFSVHGKEMAQFAVNELGYDTLAVIADSRSLGYTAATAFKEEAERLGALISTFYAADLASIGYDISPFTDQMITDSILIDSLRIVPAQALYAPFTGQAAGNLSQLLLTDLEGKRSRIPILGSEEWSTYADQPRRRHDIHYSTPFNPTPDSIEFAPFAEHYESRFGETPGFYAMVGYDAGRFVAEALQRSGNPAYLQTVFGQLPEFKGLVMRIALQRNLINGHVYIRSELNGSPRSDTTNSAARRR